VRPHQGPSMAIPGNRPQPERARLVSCVQFLGVLRLKTSPNRLDRSGMLPERYANSQAVNT
jgi:hypothetical protein